MHVRVREARESGSACGFLLNQAEREALGLPLVASASTATITRPMADGEKPYRVYRGGRVKGKVPTLPKPDGRPATTEAPPSYRGPGPVRRPRRRRRFGFWFAVVFALFLAWLTAWLLASYFTFRDGVSAANKRLPGRVHKVLVHQDGLLTFHSTTILLLGTDRGPAESPASTQVPWRTGSCVFHQAAADTRSDSLGAKDLQALHNGRFAINGPTGDWRTCF